MKSKILSKVRLIIVISVCVMSLLGCSANDHSIAQAYVQQDIVMASMSAEPEAYTETYETKTYINAKHSFTFEYPKMLNLKKKYLDDDGMYFMNDEASLLVYGSSEESQSMQVSKMSFQDRFSVQVYDEADYRICVGTKQKKDGTIYMYFKYPIAKEDTYDKVANHLIQQLTE